MRFRLEPTRGHIRDSEKPGAVHRAVPAGESANLVFRRGGMRGMMNPVASRESPVEQERRSWVEREQRFKDREEEFQRRIGAAATPEEVRELKLAFGEERRSFRREAVELGKRSPGLSVAMHQIMWARWTEVAVEHELEARGAFGELIAHPESGVILREFRASLVAIAASAHTVEAVFGDVKYLIPEQPRRAKRHKVLRHAFGVAFGVSGPEDQLLGRELSWLFTGRDSAAHPYTEPEAPVQHPAGINTGAEHSHFNAVTSGRAVDTAMAVLKLAESPRQPDSRWIERWANEREPYHKNIEELRRSRDAEPLRSP